MFQFQKPLSSHFSKNPSNSQNQKAQNPEISETRASMEVE